MNKIDLVIPFVNGGDDVWIKEFQKYNKHLTYDEIKIRYDEHDILKYVFRSIATYVPWINKIHLLLSGPSQVPEWLNTDKVHIVYHKDFIPEKHLPVFNSSAIEMYLWNIPNLSDKFLYINDDIIFNNFVDELDYYSKDDKCRLCFNNTIYKNPKYLNAAYATTFMNAAKLAAKGTEINPFFYEKLIQPDHLVHSYKKENVKHIYDLYKNEIESTITRFREEKNCNQYLWLLYDLFHEKMEIIPFKKGYFHLKKKSLDAIKNALNDVSFKELCINDVDYTTTEDKLCLIDLLEIKFPSKCIYEK